MFMIMTEAQIQAADELTLRQRVRELMTATGTLRELRDEQKKAVNCLDTVAYHLTTIAAYQRELLTVLRLIRLELAKPQQTKKARPRRAKR